MSRYINQILNSNQVSKYKLLDTLCSSDGDNIGLEQLRAFIGLLYLGNPPKNSLFNANGTARTKSEVCHFLKTQNGYIWKSVKRSLRNAAICLFLILAGAVTNLAAATADSEVVTATGTLVGAAAIAAGLGAKAIEPFRDIAGRIIGEDRKALQKNHDTLVNLVESKVSLMVQRKTLPATTMTADELRTVLMERDDFSIYMIMTIDGATRDRYSALCAGRIMRSSRVKSLLRKYTTSTFASVRFNHNVKISELSLQTPDSLSY